MVLAPGRRRRTGDRPLQGRRLLAVALTATVALSLLGGTAYWVRTAAGQGTGRDPQGLPGPHGGVPGGTPAGAAGPAPASGDPAAAPGQSPAAATGAPPTAGSGHPPAAGPGVPPSGGTGPSSGGDRPGDARDSGAGPASAGPVFDLLIRGGLVVDGSGRPAYRADVGVRGDRIAALGRLDGARARRVVDADGLVVAPGFINAHSHTYEYVTSVPGGDADLLQGMTTVIGGVDGRSPIPLGPFLRRLERQGVGTNHALFAGHGSIRAAVMGTVRREPTGAELRAMTRLLEQAMADGALGLSTGLEYVPGRYATTAEIVALARVIAPYGGIYSTHMRSEGDAVAQALAEALAIGREAGVAVDISHFKVVYRRNWEVQPQLIEQILAARAEGLAVVADVYPYRSPDYASALPLAQAWNRYPPGDLVIRHSRLPEVEGMTLAELAAARGTSPAAAARWLLDRDPGAVATALVVGEDNLRQLLRQSFTIISSDGGARSPSAARRDPRLHPRVYGAYPRVLARYVRETGVLGLEEAIHKMTGQPAAFFGLRNRGLIRVGMYADLVVFDPATVADRATWQEPAVPPEGIDLVVVNGRIAVEDGRRVPGVLAGRVLRGGRDALMAPAAGAGRD
ncbi:N-acyl-D-aspartate/D-glutamate deacylase [Thermaerobacter subterraneus DSM 13965]|uniref:N-acyl-D-aspartate/D-glutamate deacylase n=1 Tax=Thermaerobacter subterraneus DSM 13965 TaxID=867903 RepID=K6Q100_9FIRM|nr:N-acyl-D-aspartate/D-glutamate deacylase [Thermaerobacter subterraneus DSM 13965]